MKLTWKKDLSNPDRFMAETIRYRFIMLAPKRGKVQLWVQHAADDWVMTKPIDQRSCVTRRGAERIAQRFENTPHMARRLR